MKIYKNLLKSIISSLLVTMIVLNIIIISGCASNSAETVAEKAAQSYVNDDASAYCELLAPGYVEYVIGDDGWHNTIEEFQKDVIQEDIDELNDKFIERCGENYSVRVSVSNIEPCEDKAILEKVQKELIQDYNYEEGDISAVTQVEIKFRCTGNNTGGDIYHNYYCIKEKGNWYIHRPDIDSLS